MAIALIICGIAATAGFTGFFLTLKRLRAEQKVHNEKIFDLEAKLRELRSKRHEPAAVSPEHAPLTQMEDDLLSLELVRAQKLEAVRELAEKIERDLPQVQGNLEIALSELEPDHPHHIILKAAAQTATDARERAKGVLKILRSEPFAERENSSSPRESTHCAEQPRRTETILLAEDEFTLRAMTSRLLERIGYRVIAAENGAEALAIVENTKERIDLLITDVVMPLMNGSELARRICSTHPEVKVLFTSGYADDLLGRHGVLTEEVHYIGKPYTPEALAQKVRDVLVG